MNKTIFLASALGLLIVAGCSSNGTQAKESSEPQVEANIAKTEAAKPEVNVDSLNQVENRAFILDFYQKHIAKEGRDVMLVDSEAISAFMTKQAKKMLLDAYDMDCPTNDCMAVWLFYGQGIDDQVKKINVTPADEKGFFNIDLLYKGGYSYKVKVEIVRQEGKPMINSVQAL